jgi:hypothetical protein
MGKTVFGLCTKSLCSVRRTPVTRTTARIRSRRSAGTVSSLGNWPPLSVKETQCRPLSVLLLASPRSQHRQCGTACGGRSARPETLSQTSQCCVHSIKPTQSFTQTSRRMSFRFCTNAIFTACLCHSSTATRFNRLGGSEADDHGTDPALS